MFGVGPADYLKCSVTGLRESVLGVDQVDHRNSLSSLNRRRLELDLQITDAELKGFITALHDEARSFEATCGKAARPALESRTLRAGWVVRPRTPS